MPEQCKSIFWKAWRTDKIVRNYYIKISVKGEIQRKSGMLWPCLPCTYDLDFELWFLTASWKKFWRPSFRLTQSGELLWSSLQIYNPQRLGVRVNLLYLPIFRVYLGSQSALGVKVCQGNKIWFLRSSDYQLIFIWICNPNSFYMDCLKIFKAWI